MRTDATSGPRGACRVGLLAVAVTALLAAAPAATSTSRAADEPAKKVVVLVPPFENQTKLHASIGYEVATGKDPDRPKRRYTVDRYTEAPRSLLEDMLGGVEGLTVAERQRVDALLVESQFGALSGLVDTESAIRLGKLLGANLIVMGTLVDIRDETRTFSGYGIRTKGTEVICSLRVRLLDATGTVKFSKVVKGTKSFTQTNSGGTSSSDRNFAAIEAALEQLRDDPRFLEAVRGGKPGTGGAAGMVEVEFAPKPENCDVEIDGKYIGGTPLKRLLPAGKECKVRIGKGGYKPWETAIVPEAGLRITRELEPNR